METPNFKVNLNSITKNVVETTAYKKIFKICDDTKEFHELNVLTGDAGYGKTTDLISYKLKNIEDVYITKADRSSNGTIFYSDLINLIGDRSVSRSLHKHYSIRIAADLFLKQERSVLLIIDEANKFSARMLEYLHEFRDLTKTNTGILLAGTDVFETDINKWVDQKKSGIQEFRSRIFNFYKLNPPSENDIISVIRKNGIYSPKLEKNCRKLGDLREIEKRIINYQKLQKKLGLPYTI